MGSIRQAKSWTTLISGELVMSMRQRKVTHCLGSITNVPPFSGLQRFPDGHGFKQWTGNDLKALMKVCSELSLRFLQNFNVFRYTYWQFKAMYHRN